VGQSGKEERFRYQYYWKEMWVKNKIPKRDKGNLRGGVKKQNKGLKKRISLKKGGGTTR